jgi:hypothetical protein
LERDSTPPGATRATPSKSRSKGQVGAAKSKPASARAKAAGSPARTSAPDIMSRLPKSRPQRASQRRRAPVGTAARSTTPRATAPSRKASGARRSTRPAPRGGSAPSLPRMALDGAAEAAKLPLKVSGRLTLRALDAVARGLRRR